MFRCPICENCFMYTEQRRSCAMCLCLYAFAATVPKYHHGACCMAHLIETKGSISGLKKGFVSSLFSVVVCLWSVEGRDPTVSDLLIIPALVWLRLTRGYKDGTVKTIYICAGVAFSSILLADITAVVDSREAGYRIHLLSYTHTLCTHAVVEVDYCGRLFVIRSVKRKRQRPPSILLSNNNKR